MEPHPNPEPAEDKKEKDLHIDNFPSELKKKAKRKALDEDKTFKQWVIDLFKVAVGESVHTGSGKLVLDSTDEGEKAKARKGPKAAFR